MSVRTKKEDLTSQVDGITDVFTTTMPYRPGTLMLGYNGQVFPVMRNIENEINSYSFQISFVPQVDCTDALHIIFEHGTDDMMASGLPPGACS